MSLGDMIPEDSHSREIWLINTGRTPARLTALNEDSEFLVVDQDPAGTVIPANGATSIRVTMTMPMLEGPVDVPVTFEFESLPPVEMIVSGIVRHAPRRGKFKEREVTVVPGPIVLPDCAPKAVQPGEGWFINRSDRPVTFVGMKPTCACITPVPRPRETIAPGQIGHFEFTMEAAEYIDRPKRKSMQLLFEDDIVSVIGIEVTARTQETLDQNAAAAANPPN